MQRNLHTDDDMLRIHDRYMGPPGMTWPVSIPLRGVIPFLAVFALTLIVLSAFGVGLWRFVIAAALGGGAMWLTDLYGGAERPVSSLPAILSHESGAPRPQSRQTIHAVLRPSRVPRKPYRQPRAALASDADREQAVDTLESAHTAGRLTLRELDTRTGRALTARTYGELAAATARLPGQPAEQMPASRPGRCPAPPVDRPADGRGRRPVLRKGRGQ